MKTRYRINLLKKSLLLLTIFVLMAGCAHTPLPTDKLTGGADRPNGSVNNLHYSFIDARDERIKTEDCFVLQYMFPTWLFSCGDKAFDTPLNKGFEKIFLARFSDSPKGLQTEIKLRNFYFTYKPHEMAGLLFVGLFFIFADVEYHGIAKIDVAILDQNNKYIFAKTYDADLREMKPYDATIYEAGLDMLNKAFAKISAEFENDAKRINFN